MTVSEYAKKNGVSKQSIYDRIKRGTLLSETINGVKQIVESSSQPTLFKDSLLPTETGCLKKLEKALHKLEKALKKADKFKQKLLIEQVQLRSMGQLVLSKDSEIDSLKKSLGLVQSVIDTRLLSAPDKSIIVDPLPKKSRKKKKK